MPRSWAAEVLVLRMPMATAPHLFPSSSFLIVYYPFTRGGFKSWIAMSPPFQRSLRLQRLVYRSLVQRRCFAATRNLRWEPWEEPSHEGGHTGPNIFRKYHARTDIRFASTEQSAPSGQSAIRQQNVPYSRVRIQVDGKKHEFSPILLRDLCGCPQCVDPSTKQKYRLTTDIPASIQPRSMSQSESGVRIHWHNDIPGYDRDHCTDIDTTTLRQYVRHCRSGIAVFSPGAKSLWDAAEYRQLADMPYETYMQSDEALYKILRQLHTYGLAFLTDVPDSASSVSNIAERIGPIKNTFYGYTWDVRSVPESKNVAYTSQDLGFHMDLLYMEQPPHLQFLHCIRSSSAGGASLFTDSYRAASDLLESDLDAFECLRSCGVDFHYNHPSSALYHQQRTVFEFDSRSYTGGSSALMSVYEKSKRAATSGESYPRDRFGKVMPMDHLRAVSWSPPFQAPFGYKPAQGSKTPLAECVSRRVDDWHSAAQKFNALIHRPEMIYERLMKPGECVLFDNRRVLHARKAFEVGDVGKERWLRGAYLDKDPYSSKLRVLEHQRAKNAAENVSGDRKEDFPEAAAGMS